MKRRTRATGILKGVFVVCGAVALSTFAINASDTFHIPGASLLAGAGGSVVPAHCPSDMVYVSDTGGGFCIDRYEAAAGETCPHSDPQNQFETQEDLDDPLCMSVSKKGLHPWVNVPEHQALALCAKVGKRLPGNREWYRAAIGTPDAVTQDGESCVLGRVGQVHADPTGTHATCVSSSGAYDMVGNVWEWVDASVHGGTYEDRELPDEGYVADADVDGVAVSVGATATPSYGDDYFFSEQTGVHGMFRGGFWAMDERAGVYSINATIPTAFVGAAVGFRCVREAQ